MMRWLSRAILALAAVPVVRAQQPMPIVDLPAARVKTAVTFGGILGVRELANGSVLVNDGARHQVSLVDSTFRARTVVRDSVDGTPASYGPRPKTLIRYLGDSSLIPDNQLGTLLVIGPNGQVARAMAPSHPKELLGLNLYFGAVDARGRITFGAHSAADFQSIALKGVSYLPESTLIIRTDPESRGADTLAKLRTQSSTMMFKGTPCGQTSFTTDPAPLVDDWAMASDGSIAVIRGQDYHIDWIKADGSTFSTPKLPFDWKRMTDEDKQRLIDSVRAEESPKMSAALSQRRAAPPPDNSDGGRSGGRGSSTGVPTVQGPPVAVEYVPPALKDMFDYYPPVRIRTTLADLDGNVWILPTSSAQSKNGELVYDVVNVKGDFHRVRVPLGRSIVGFGKAGVVYMISGDKTNGFYLERTALPKK
jgi:hypothetical protein